MSGTPPSHSTETAAPEIDLGAHPKCCKAPRRVAPDETEAVRAVNKVKEDYVGVASGVRARAVVGLRAANGNSAFSFLFFEGRKGRSPLCYFKREFMDPPPPVFPAVITFPFVKMFTKCPDAVGRDAQAKRLRTAERKSDTTGN